ncbi:hypothetical protein LguiB_004317 [Lonicera macranthoides]
MANLPKGYEERIERRGIVVREWAPQSEVLALREEPEPKNGASTPSKDLISSVCAYRRGVVFSTLERQQQKDLIHRVRFTNSKSPQGLQLTQPILAIAYLGRLPNTSLQGQLQSEYQAKKETYRSNVVGFVRTYHMLRENGLNDNHVRAIRATPFWLLFKAYHKGWVSEKSHKKYDSNVRTLIESFDLGQRSFRIGNQLVELTPDDVAKIFGLPNEGIPIDLNTRVTPSGKFFKRYFVRGQPINRSQVESALKDAIEGETEEDVKDVARLVCLHFMICLKFTNTNHKLGWFFVQWIENLDQNDNYNWALAVYEFLLDSNHKETPRSYFGEGACTLAIGKHFL